MLHKVHLHLRLNCLLQMHFMPSACSLKQVLIKDRHCLGISFLVLSVLETGCYACRAFPEAFTLRCFAFEPSDQQVDSATSRKDNMVMFPPVTTGGQ